MSQFFRNETLSRDGVVQVMKDLGWITHDQEGTLTDETFHVAKELAGKVTFNVMLSCQIAAEVDKYRAAKKKAE